MKQMTHVHTITSSCPFLLIEKDVLGSWGGGLHVSKNYRLGSMDAVKKSKQGIARGGKKKKTGSSEMLNIKFKSEWNQLKSDAVS